MRATPVSITARMPGTVSEVSATFVASTMRAPSRGLEHALLLFLRQTRVERQHLATLRMLFAQRLGRLADLALAGQEHEDVARLLAPELVDRRRIASCRRRWSSSSSSSSSTRPVAHLDRKSCGRTLR